MGSHSLLGDTKTHPHKVLPLVPVVIEYRSPTEHGVAGEVPIIHVGALGLVVNRELPMLVLLLPPETCSPMIYMPTVGSVAFDSVVLFWSSSMVLPVELVAPKMVRSQTLFTGIGFVAFCGGQVLDLLSPPSI
jgi:hypothetical protein